MKIPSRATPRSPPGRVTLPDWTEERKQRHEQREKARNRRVIGARGSASGPPSPEHSFLVAADAHGLPCDFFRVARREEQPERACARGAIEVAAGEAIRDQIASAFEVERLALLNRALREGGRNASLREDPRHAAASTMLSRRLANHRI